MRISDWSSDVCSSDLGAVGRGYAPDGFSRRGVHVSEVRNQCAEIKNRRGRSPDLRGAVIPSAARDPGRGGNSSLAALGTTRTGKVPAEAQGEPGPAAQLGRAHL